MYLTRLLLPESVVAWGSIHAPWGFRFKHLKMTQFFLKSLIGISTISQYPAIRRVPRLSAVGRNQHTVTSASSTGNGTESKRQKEKDELVVHDMIKRLIGWGGSFRIYTHVHMNGWAHQNWVPTPLVKLDINLWLVSSRALSKSVSWMTDPRHCCSWRVHKALGYREPHHSVPMAPSLWSHSGQWEQTEGTHLSEWRYSLRWVALQSIVLYILSSYDAVPHG